MAQHKIIESLPKQKTKYSDSQGTLSKTILSSLHDLPTKIALPTKLQNYHRFHVQEQCLHQMLQTVQKPTRSRKGSRLSNKASDQNPVTSHDFQWCSTDLSPDPSTFDTTSPRRSASLHPPDLHSIVANLIAFKVKVFDGFVDAQGIGQGLEEMESRAWHRQVEPIFYVSANCLHIDPKRNSSGFLHSITKRPWGHHHQYCSHSSAALWLFGSCEGHQPRPEKKLQCQSPSWSIFLDPKKGLRQSRICIQLNSTPVAQSQITISNLEVRKLTRRTACLTNPCNSKLVMHELFYRISPSYSCSWIPGKYASNFPQQLIFQRNFSQTCR